MTALRLGGLERLTQVRPAQGSPLSTGTGEGRESRLGHHSSSLAPPRADTQLLQCFALQKVNLRHLTSSPEEAGSWRTSSELSQPELIGPVLPGELKETTEITAETFLGGHSQNQVMFHMRKREISETRAWSLVSSALLQSPDVSGFLFVFKTLRKRGWNFKHLLFRSRVKFLSPGQGDPTLTAGPVFF